MAPMSAERSDSSKPTSAAVPADADGAATSAEMPAALGRFPIQLDVPVAWGDMDSLGHVNNVVYLRWFESARIAYFEALAIGTKRASVGPILARQSIDYHRQLHYPDRIRVSTSVSRIGTTSVTMTYRVTSEAAKGAVVADGESVIVLFDYATAKKVKVDKAIRQQIQELEAGPSHPTVKVSKPPVDAYELILEPPKGFRPHDWPQRLMNWDEAAEIGEDLVYSKIAPGHGETLAIRAELVDPKHPKGEDRLAVWNSLVAFLKDNDFTVRIDPRLQPAEPRLFQLCKDCFDQNGIRYRIGTT